MKTYSCVSLSGGQGKTTSIFLLSLMLARKDKRVLAIDSDPQANLTFYLGHEVNPTEPSLFEVLSATVKPEHGIYPTDHENLFLMPADRGLFKVTDYLANSGAGAFVLKLRLKAIADLFDYVLIDVQPTRSQLCLTSVGASDGVLIPVEANVKGMNSLIDTWSFLQEQANLMAFTGEIVGILPFRDRWFGQSQSIESRDNIAAMRKFAGDVPVFPSIIESEQFKRAIRQGKLLQDLGHPALEYPLNIVMEAIDYERATVNC